jgi:hypothetical protein
LYHPLLEFTDYFAKYYFHLDNCIFSPETPEIHKCLPFIFWAKFWSFNWKNKRVIFQISHSWIPLGNLTNLIYSTHSVNDHLILKDLFSKSFTNLYLYFLILNCASFFQKISKFYHFLTFKIDCFSMIKNQSNYSFQIII